jgi:hypothetical protein
MSLVMKFIEGFVFFIEVNTMNKTMHTIFYFYEL